PIIAIGFPYSEAVRSVAAEFPGTKFAIVDGEAAGNNVSNLVFAEQEGGFLAGVAAGGRVIGAEGDEARTADATLRDVVLTSITKRVDTVVFDYLKDFSTGSAKSGPIVYDIKDHGFDYTTTGNQIDGITARLDEMERKIADGQIVVPGS
ncbi:BMP family ABC transporter substrate-binding protein, partial [Sphaerisporangium sp. NPDC088356]|uniref:BMP family lipoprotein n=1 Tax=Sphaerisporangium sp. NPDC088356 TaxID=3154871 RepID=UPI0034492E93